MRRIFALVALMVVALGLAMPAFAQERPTITEWLAADADGRFTMLAAGLEAAGLTETLSGEGPFTVFAPTNDAFTAALEGLGMSVEDLVGNPELLTSVLSYHIVPGRYQYINLTRGPELETLEGSPLQITLDAGFLYANDVVVSDPDGIASNGVVHAIDGVLVPPSMAAAPEAEATAEPTEEAEAEAPAGVALERPDVLAALAADADGRFTMLAAAIEAAGLTETLSGEGPFTILAPTNDAFTAALETLGMSPVEVMANPDLLTGILSYHVIPGRYQYINLTSGPSLETLEGEAVQFLLDGGFLYANDVVVSDPDLLASNGVIHAIDGVLMPPSMAAAPEAEATAEPTAEAEAEPPAGVALERPNVLATLTGDADGRFTMLAAAIEAAGLTETLFGEGPFTILAPTNDAFTAALEGLGMSPVDAMADPDLLTGILSYHIIPERLQYINLTSGPSVETLEGSPVQFHLAGGVLTVNNVAVSDPDLLASNGVIHAIDGVLLPPSAAAIVPAHVRVAHLSPDSGNVDVYVNNALTLVDLPFSAVSEWLTLPAGATSIAIAPAGTSVDDAVIGPLDLTLAINSWVTVAAVGSSTAETPTLTAQIVPEDSSEIAEGNARVTFMNAIEGGSAVNVVANGRVIVSNLQFPGSYIGSDGNPNDGAFTLELPAGGYDISFTAGGATLFDLPGTTLDAGTSYLILATGTADSTLPVVSATSQ